MVLACRCGIVVRIKYKEILFVCKLFGYECFHLGECGLYTLCEFQLVATSDEVVLVIFAVEIYVTVDIVGNEAHECHVGEQSRGERQVFDFDWCDKRRCALEISLGE